MREGTFLPGNSRALGNSVGFKLCIYFLLCPVGTVVVPVS